MRSLDHLFRRFTSCGALLILAGLLWTGCRHPEKAEAINPSQRFVFPGEAVDAGGATNDPAPGTTGPESGSASDHGMLMRVGEKIIVMFSDLPPPGLMPHEQRIREDGTVTLPFNKTVQAAGKTARQLEEDIRNKYVPTLYKRLTVTVKAEERFFYVGGEVKTPMRQMYLGPMTVLRAIQAAGDFTDFANRKKIELSRATGEKHKINWYKAIKDAQLDLEVFPGDTIIVHRRWF